MKSLMQRHVTGRLALGCRSVHRASDSLGRYLTPKITKQHGIDALHDPLWNKGTAFTWAERDRLNLRGLIPPVVRTIDQQLTRIMEHLAEEEDPVKQNLYLQDLHARNETLYHRVIVDNVDMIAPLIYTPTVGVVCQEFGHTFRRSRGMYFGRVSQGHFGTMMYNWPHEDVRVIVVTDGSRILGLGDLGVHGMGIPIGKLALYVAAGGIPPECVLPVVLDVGTNNVALRNNADYMGSTEPRLEGEEYYELVEEFMNAVFARWPDVVVQFEDFETSKAVPLLAKYRHKYRCFNDDIQGTGCVTLAGVVACARQAGLPITEMTFMCAGAGSAGLGVCQAIVDGMVEAGLSREEAYSKFVVCSSVGAIGNPDGKNGDPNHSRGLNAERSTWVNNSVSDGTSMLDVVKQFKPTCILGLAAQPAGLFSEELVRAQAAVVEHPIIMPMSNPTAKAECTPEQAYTWTDGRAVVATGSPFEPVTLKDGSVRIPSQCNNVYVFPGIGLAASVAGVKSITDRMLYRAAVACTDSMDEKEIAAGRTFPELNRIRDVSVNVASAVIDEAFQQNLTTKLTRADVPNPGDLERLVSESMYFPDYHPLVDPTRSQR